MSKYESKWIPFSFIIFPIKVTLILFLLAILKILFLFFFLIAATAIQCEEQIDIWKNKNNSSNQNVPQEKLNIEYSKVLNSNFKINKDSEIQIENNLAENTPTTNIYGVYDP